VLTPLQQRVAHIVADLPDAEDFVLAGGGALIARGDVDRTTRDLDYFATRPERVLELLPHLVAALEEAGLTVETNRAVDGFVRLVVTDGVAATDVDLASDYRLLPPEPSPAGRALAAEELAVDKVLAIFDRGEGRDFADLAAVVDRWVSTTCSDAQRRRTAASPPPSSSRHLTAQCGSGTRTSVCRSSVCRGSAQRSPGGGSIWLRYPGSVVRAWTNSAARSGCCATARVHRDAPDSTDLVLPLPRADPRGGRTQAAIVCRGAARDDGRKGERAVGRARSPPTRRAGGLGPASQSPFTRPVRRAQRSTSGQAQRNPSAVRAIGFGNSGWRRRQSCTTVGRFTPSRCAISVALTMSSTSTFRPTSGVG
jgi:hypothetical protein